MNARASTILLAALAACSGDRSDAAARSAPVLRPMLGELRRLTQHRPIEPTDAVQRELRELTDIATGLVEADARTATIAARNLVEHEHAGPFLVPLLRHEDAAVRCRAAWLVGRTGRADLQFALLLRLKDETDPDAALWLASSLHRLGNDAGLAWLDAAIDVERTAESAGQRTLELLGEDAAQLPDPPTWAALHEQLRARIDAWRRTGRGGHAPAVPADPDNVLAVLAAHLLATEGTALRPVDEARFVLTHAGASSLPLLEQALAAEEPYLRTMALQVLTELGPVAASCGPAVAPLLGDPLCAAYAVRALGELGHAASLPDLRALLRARDSELRAAAAHALGLLRDAASTEVLRRHLDDAAETLDVRVESAFALLRLGDDPRARAFLDERATRGDYHRPTLDRLTERLAERR